MVAPPASMFSRVQSLTFFEVFARVQTVALLTAEEFARLPEDGRRTELVRGEVLEMNVPVPRHGEVCLNLGAALKSYLKTNSVGRVASNDAGILTERNPDSVRGPDLFFISNARLPGRHLPTEYLSMAPEIVFEVLSPTDRWADVFRKTGEYLAAGVEIVCVIDFDDESVHLYFDRKPEVVLRSGGLLEFPEHLPGFSLPLTELFE